MKDLNFFWDSRKNKQNIKKHGVGFEEAKTVFYDPKAVQYYGPDHSEDEERFILLGLSARLHILIVCHCYRERGSLIRIISAREADDRERESCRG